MKLTQREREIARRPVSNWLDEALRNGISKKNYRQRCARGWSPKEAATVPPRKPKGAPGIVAKCEAAGIDPRRVYRKRDGVKTDDEILAEIIARKGEPSLAAKCEAAGVVKSTVYRRRRRDSEKTDDEIIAEVLAKRQSTLAKKCRQRNANYARVRRRLVLGWELEAALSAPLNTRKEKAHG